MLNAREVVDLIGREALADDLGVLAKTVGIAAATGQFPASWYVVVNAAAAKHGAQVPLCLFRFKMLAPAAGDVRVKGEVAP